MSIDLSNLKNKVISKLDDLKNKKTVKNLKDVNIKKKNKKSDVDILRQEALALGASEKDIELIHDLSDDSKSEQEFNGDNIEVDTVFNTDFQNLLKDIGFDNKLIVIDDIKEKNDVDNETCEEVVLNKNEKKHNQNKNDNEIKKNNKSDVKDMNKTVSSLSSTQEEKNQTLIIPSDIEWYQIPVDNIEECTSLTQHQIDSLYEIGKRVLEQDNKKYYDEFIKISSQKRFMSQILSDGTLNDKISALTLLIQESCVHNLKSFETLLSYCSKKSRNSALQSLNALKDLLINGMLPNDRKLKYFKNQKLSNNLSEKTLALYYYEDYLKNKFFQILEIMERLSHDPIIYVRMQVLTHVFDFISNHPEQEFNLLKLGVNKLGDIDNNVSSKASYQLLKLQQLHPNMKSIIIDNIIDIVVKPNNDYHTVYYSVLTLNQTILKRSDDKLANNLIKTYFTIFEKYLIKSDSSTKEIDDNTDINKKVFNKKRNFKRGKKGGKSIRVEQKDAQTIIDDNNSKLFSAILTGINRAFHFSNLSNNIYEIHLDTLFKITHGCNFSTSIQALVLIHQIISKANINNDRYYNTLYESLLDPRLINSSKQTLYLNLLYKSLKEDVNISRIDSFVKRILQVCSNWLNIGSITGFFYLLIQLSEGKPQLKNLLINSPSDDNYDSNLPYDGFKRDPKYSNAINSSLWEINQFINHYHPSIQTYAIAFLNNNKDKITKPDLGLLSTVHFLDKFVYRNPKKKSTLKGSSIMQPLSGYHTGNLLVKSSDLKFNDVPVNIQDWITKKIDEINPNEKFFHQYFTMKSTVSKLRKKTEKDDELNENDVWNALVKSMPQVEEDEDEESDIFDQQDFNSSDDDLESLEPFETTDFSVSEISDKDSDVEGEKISSHTKKRSFSISANDQFTQSTSDQFTQKSKKQKKALKDLPTFASAEDYAEYLSD